MRVPETATLRGLLGAVVGAVNEPAHPKLYGRLWALYLGLSERNGEVSEGDRRDTIEEVLPFLPQVSRLGAAGYNAVKDFRTGTGTD
jgi:hypothetical protein